MPTLYYVYVDTSGKAAYGEVIPPHCEIIGMSGTEEGAFKSHLTGMSANKSSRVIHLKGPSSRAAHKTTLVKPSA